MYPIRLPTKIRSLSGPILQTLLDPPVFYLLELSIKLSSTYFRNSKGPQPNKTTHFSTRFLEKVRHRKIQTKDNNLWFLVVASQINEIVVRDVRTLKTLKAVVPATRLRIAVGSIGKLWFI